MGIDLTRLLMLREAIASVAIETGHHVSLSEVLLAMTEAEERARRAERKRACARRREATHD